MNQQDKAKEIDSEIKFIARADALLSELERNPNPAVNEGYLNFVRGAKKDAEVRLEKMRDEAAED